MSRDPLTVVITGPTSTGKTALSIAVARELDGEIISMDSRQLYRGMDIGTAKPTAEQRAAVPHHGLDLVDPDERFNAGRFARYARDRISDIAGRGRIPLLVGGTGFFLRALTHPIFREPPLDPDRRRRLDDYLATLPDDVLRRWLMVLDPPLGESLQVWGGRQRLLRGLELPLLTGRSLSWWHTHSPADEPPLEPLVYVLELERERLDRAIDDRVTGMIEGGLEAEIRTLMAAGYDEHSPGLNATGYIEMIPFLREEKPLDEAIQAIQRNTRRYARRQTTWFRNQLPEGAIRLDASMPHSELVARIAGDVRRARREAS